MARRRGKSSSKQDDSWLTVEAPTGQLSRGFNEYVVPGVLLLIVAVGGSGLGWVCSDQQQMIESLSETLASMQARITKLQQQIGPDNPQLGNFVGFEERLMALEDAYAKAQRQVELALATSEQIKSKDLQSKVWSLQSEMNDKLAELQQNTISIAALNAIIKNKSIEFEVVKQSVNTMLSANAELAIQVAGFSSTLSVNKLRLDEQIFVVDGLMSQLEGQKREINEIKDLFANNKESLAVNSQELMDIKELLESEQIKRTQKLEKQMKSLYKRLEDYQSNTESLHFHLAAQLEALQIQGMSEEKSPDSCRRNSGCTSVLSIEQMLAVNPGKTPISLLQEYGTRIGKTPVYDLLKAEGQAHQPNFTFRVSVGEISCTGQGPSKKAAKHKAAEAALKMLKGGMLEALKSTVMEGEHFDDIDIPLEGDCSQTELKLSSSSQQAECNPVGALQELVVQKGWRLPEYTVTQESGPAHRKEFTMTCKVEKFVEIGSGTSKKLAKRNAAAKMLSRIHDVPVDMRSSHEAEAEDDTFNMHIGGRLESVKCKGFGCTWDSLRNSAGEKILQLRSHPLGLPNSNFCSLLHDLSEEQRFDVRYLDIEECSLSGLYQCLVELSTQPIAVCHGFAPSQDAARASAAHNALQYLKIMASGK
ncbi:RISC-loading complex subunit tarbp2 isoform X1 [Tachysurus fulvidraco]|uniref:RISC-loading complex subunit tarbp2 isoform X1 n=3 Tax=Tachysurus fulvidraco TaxID=1234273 RepID=UPI000F51065A|nr:RISC-loading complex subunit tarbp2 isoform X1 [Tachysurus fulvidraco]